MTHMSNYGNDRLGLYTFESVIKFIQCWTNIRLSSAPPLQLAESYFKLYPGESDPVWGVSCILYVCIRIFIQNIFCRIHVMIVDIKKFGQKINRAILFRNF